jgi:hypothetical protein
VQDKRIEIGEVDNGGGRDEGREGGGGQGRAGWVGQKSLSLSIIILVTTPIMQKETGTSRQR